MAKARTAAKRLRFRREAGRIYEAPRGFDLMHGHERVGGAYAYAHLSERRGEWYWVGVGGRNTTYTDERYADAESAKAACLAWHRAERAAGRLA